MYTYNSPEHTYLKVYADSGVLLHENKVNVPERATLFNNGHLDRQPHPAGGNGYKINKSGLAELASIQPPTPDPVVVDPDVQKASDLRGKIDAGTISTNEKSELLDIVLKKARIF